MDYLVWLPDGESGSRAEWSGCQMDPWIWPTPVEPRAQGPVKGKGLHLLVFVIQCLQQSPWQDSEREGWHGAVAAGSSRICSLGKGVL